jgi:hypothetical protein
VGRGHDQHSVRPDSRYGSHMIRSAVVSVILVVVGLTGCASPSPAPPDAKQSDQSTQLTSPSDSPADPGLGVECLTVSETWVAHIQEFMDEGYTVNRGAGVRSGERFFSLAVLYTSPAGEEILGSWGAGEDPSSDTVSMVFPLDDVTASHTVVMMPNTSILAEVGAGTADATACLG